MSIFDRIKKTPSAPYGAGASVTAKAKKKAAQKPEPAASESKASVTASEKKIVTSEGIRKSEAFTLLKPHVSEKAAHLSGKGIYVFDVPVTANKVEIRKAVERQYHVNVIAVRTIRGLGKFVRRGPAAGRIGRRNRWKKAMVELKKGQTINLVEGV